MIKRESLLYVVALPMLVVLAYWQGLPGPFLLDDFSNLEALYQSAPIRSAEDAWTAALSSGIAGPSGRPVALLSFFIDDFAWPSSPDSFKYTNVLIHAINSLLLFWLFTLITGLSKQPADRHALFVAALAAALWALHPFQVSTTLYVIQRMAMLAATFALIAFILYIKAELAARSGRIKSATLMLASCFLVASPLSFFSKENAALIPIMILAIKLTVLAHGKPKVKTRAYRNYGIISTAPLYLTVIALIFFFIRSIPGWEIEYATKKLFSMDQRFLTQSRVLVDYIYQILVPHMEGRGFYNERFQISRGLFSPSSTFISIAFISLALIFALVFRKRFQYFSCAILFYLSGHLLESTIAPLELYYEHRNYLPSCFMFLAIAYLLASARVRLLFKSVLIVVVLTIYLSLTILRANLWGDPVSLGLVWLEKGNQSMRAHQQAAKSWELMGRPDLADNVLREGAQKVVGKEILVMQRAILHCAYNTDSGVIKDAIDSLRNGLLYATYFYDTMRSMIESIEKNSCEISPEDIEKMLNAVLENPRIYHAISADFVYLRARLKLADGREEEAMSDFLSGAQYTSNCEMLLQGMAMLGTKGRPDLSLQLLQNFAESAPESVCIKSVEASAERNSKKEMLRSEVERLKGILLKELDAGLE